MFLPGEATLGLAGAAMITGKMYFIGGVTNAFADSTDPFDDSVDRFLSDNEYFTTLELGWTKSQEQIYFDNTHFTFWHVDNSPQAGAIQGWGISFSHIQYINDRWMPFVRGGYADDGGSLLQKSLSAGFLYQKTPAKNLLGFGLNWGQPNESTFVPGLDDQITMETFYRIQITQQFALTPTLQFLKNPALNPVDDSLWVLGLRARLAL
jgi:porin